MQDHDDSGAGPARPVGRMERPFYFLRHGETFFNRERRMQGQFDAPLNPEGLEQAERAARDLADAPIKRIVASPLSRAFNTAEAVATKHGLSIEPDPELMEVHLGVHQGHLYEDWMPDFWAGNFAPEGGEDFWQFRARVWPAMVRIVAEGSDTLIVAHGGLWIAARTLVHMEPDIKVMPNALPLYIVPDGDTWHVQPVGSSQLPG